MTEDDAGRQASRKAVTRSLPASSRRYNGLLTYLGVRLYEERNRRRREAADSEPGKRGTDDAAR